MTLSAAHIDDFAAGARLLASGGGGDLDVAIALLRTLMREVNLRAAKDLTPETLVVHVGMAGAPDVLEERLINVDDLVEAVHMVAKEIGRPAGAIGVSEIGGLNALVAVAVAQQMGLPLVDGDIMARAYPRIVQTTLTAAGFRADPVALVSPAGVRVVLSNCRIPDVDALVVSCSRVMGGLAALALYPITAGELVGQNIDGSVSACIQLGRTYARLRTERVETLAAGLGLTCFYEGRIDEIRPHEAGLVGSITLSATATPEPVRVDFANEYIAVTVGGILAAASPDVIFALDHLSRYPLHPERLQLGQTVIFGALPSMHVWPSAALELIGPQSYGSGWETVTIR